MSTEKYKILKKYFKQIYLQIHPDFFSNSPTIKQENERSITLLNGLLTCLCEKTLEHKPFTIKYTTKTGRNINFLMNPLADSTPLAQRKYSQNVQLKILEGGWIKSILQLLEHTDIKASKEDLNILQPKIKMEKREDFGQFFKQNIKRFDKYAANNHLPDDARSSIKSRVSRTYRW
jgi:hypothetical protein